MPAPDIYNSAYVASLFDRMSRTYGVANYLTSFGFTERWRRQCVAGVDWSRPGMSGYDLMSGMGEIWESVMAVAPPDTVIRGVDISQGMNERASRQITDHPEWDVAVLQADALDSGIPGGSADFIVSSFGLKTFSESQQQRLAAETARILRPGGQFSFVEISCPANPLRLPFMFYLKHLVPVIGRVFMRDDVSYRMLGQYTERYGNAGNFTAALSEQGLSVSYRPLFFGCASLVSGTKP